MRQACPESNHASDQSHQRIGVGIGASGTSDGAGAILVGLGHGYCCGEAEAVEEKVEV